MFGDADRFLDADIAADRISVQTFCVRCAKVYSLHGVNLLKFYRRR